MEYLYTNLPRYVTVTPRSAFANSVVQAGSVLLFSEDGSTLTAKLPDGSFITVGGSGGTDVSSTTAEAGDVLAGKVFYTSGGMKTSGTITSKAAATYTPTTTDQTISAGQYLAGAQTILGDANLVAGNIASGVTIFGVAGTLVTSGGADVTLGYITSDGKFQALTFSGTSAADSGEPVTLSAYTWNLPEPASSGVIIYSGGSIVSSAGSVMSGNNISSGMTQAVYSGGTAVSATVREGGLQFIYAGGSAVGANVYGSQIVGGTATSDTLKLSGYIMVLPGGKALDLTVDGNNGSLYVSSGGTAHGTNPGGNLVNITSETGAEVSIYTP